MSESIEKRDVFGFPVAVSTVDAVALELEREAVTAQAPYCVAAADVHVIMRGVESKAYADVLFRMDLICPDGMPIVHLLNKNRDGDSLAAERVSGPDLMMAVMRDSDGESALKHFFLGGRKSTLDLLEKNFHAKYPDVHIAGVYSPPFRKWTDEDDADMINRIRESGANIVWVGLGCPKQEKWIIRLRDRLPAGVYVGVGAAFDFHAGTVKRAPLWMQRLALEWVYRIIKEPKRLLKRYLKYNTKFFVCLALGRRAGAK